MGCGSAKSAKPDEQSSGGDNKAAEQGNAAAGGGDNKQFLTKVELFKRLPPEELPNLANKMESVTIEPGTTIIKQGDLGNEFFVIKTGSAKVVVNEENVATLKGGDYFGEQALLRDDPRNASIIAQTTIEALKITRDKFVSLGLNEKLEFAKRGAVGAGASDAKVKPPDLKTQKEIELITAALKNNANLTTMITLDDAKTKAMIDLMWKEDVAKGKEIITEGDDNADYFYVVNSGAFEATKEVPDNSSADKHVGRSQSVGTLQQKQVSESLLCCTMPHVPQPSQQLPMPWCSFLPGNSLRRFWNQLQRMPQSNILSYWAKFLARSLIL
jgi:CRP-like cAMP-binding protein